MEINRRHLIGMAAALAVTPAFAASSDEDAVKAALVSRGVDPGRIGTEGYGKAYPVASNNDSGGRQLNRRVEVVIGNRGGSAIAPRSGL